MQPLVQLALRAIRAVLGTMLLASVLLICANAFGRYVLHAPVIWAEEVLGYGLVWMVYLGAVLVTASDQHLKMDLISQLMSPRVQIVLRLIGNAILIAVGLLIIYQSIDSVAEFKHHSQVANLPMQVMHAVIPASFIAIVIVVIVLSIRDLGVLLRGDDAAGGTTTEDGQPA